ncbi:MAG: hypothetical protein LBE51_08880 [Acidovorax sp.]|nr:hypothetical protein [Acidovorax sp.]
MAWLNATPKPKPDVSTNKKSRKQDDAAPPTRREKLLAEGRERRLPDAGPAGYLLRVLFDVGPLQSGGMGAAPLDYVQLQAWQQCHGTRLSPWEAEQLRWLSCEYFRELQRGEDPNAAAPGSLDETPEQQQDRRERVNKGLGARLRALAETMQR